MTAPARRQVTIRLRTDLADRLDEEADTRVVGRNLLLERALEHYLDHVLPPVPARPTTGR